jgi:DnaJ-class molecular chaperone
MAKKRLEFGTVAPCPTCKGKGTKMRKGEGIPCPTCRGKGYVPNEGPIA